MDEAQAQEFNEWAARERRRLRWLQWAFYVLAVLVIASTALSVTALVIRMGRA